jgi:TonB family protein
MTADPETLPSPAGARRVRPPWRRRFAALAVVLVGHGLLAWLFVGRSHGLEGRIAALDLAYTDPHAIAVTLPQGRREGGTAGGVALGGQGPETAAIEPTRGDGTSNEGQGGGGADWTQSSQAAQASPAPGDAAELRGGSLDAAPGSPMGAVLDNAYQRLLLRHIRAFRLYPVEAARRRSEGVVVVRFRVSRDGAIEEAWVARGSRDVALDRAALDTLWRAEPLPAVPSELPAPIEVELPVPFRLPGR